MYPANLKREFWTVFGNYMKPVLGSSMQKVNWINYKTGNRNVVFKIYFTANEATVEVVLSQSAKQLLLSLWDHDISFMENEHGNLIITKADVNIFERSTWPQAISFLKNSLIKLDEFWVNHKDFFGMG